MPRPGAPAKEEPVNFYDPTEGVEQEKKQDEHDLTLAILAELRDKVKCRGEDWYVYDHGRWRKSSKDEFRALAQELCIDKVTSQKIRGALYQVESSLQMEPQERFWSFYRQPQEGIIELNCANGVVEISGLGGRVKRREHSPKDMFTHQIAAEYRGRSPTPAFSKVVGENIPDPLDRELLKLFSGYILLPNCKYEVALVLKGEAGTGKSILAEAIKAALGPELCTTLSLSQLSNPENKNLAKLESAALNINTELDAIEVAGEIFKVLVSGEPIEADRKFRDSITMRTPCKLLSLAKSHWSGSERGATPNCEGCASSAW
jgi:phage/plasmid-associated DNA primase